MGTACCSPSISCKLPSALSQPLVCTCVYAHCWEVQWYVLGKIMSKPGRPAEPVMSPSVLAFSAELLTWVITPQSLSAPLLLIFWMPMSPLFQAQHPWGPAACTYGDTYLCSSKVGGQAVLPLLLIFLLHPYLFLKTESSKLFVTFPSQHQLFLRGQAQACGSLLGSSNSRSRKWVWTDGSGPNLLPVNGWQLLQFLWCCREGRALPDSAFSLADCICQEQHMVLGASREPPTGDGCRSPTATQGLSGPAGWHQLKQHTAKCLGVPQRGHPTVSPKGTEVISEESKILRLCSVLLRATSSKAVENQAVFLTEMWHLRMVYSLCLQMRRGKPW